VLFGVMFVKGSVRINLQKFFRVTTAILFFVALQLIISGLHELSETGVLPSSKREMALIGPIVRNDMFFFVTIVALAALMILFEAKRRQTGKRSDFGCTRSPTARWPLYSTPARSAVRWDLPRDRTASCAATAQRPSMARAWGPPAVAIPSL